MCKKIKKAFALIFACSLLATGCAGKTEPANSETADTKADKEVTEAKADDSQPGYIRDKDKKVKLSWYINFSWFPTKWGVDPTSKAFTEKTGVDVEFIVPAGNESEKLNAMIASDTLPDLLTLNWDAPQINQMIEGDMLYPLNELADKYDPYFYKVANPQRLAWYTKEDGNVYGYPNASYSPEDYEKYDVSSNLTFVVRKDMYEAIGKPDMSTPEGFTNAIKKAKEMFPTVNNQPLIPFGVHEFQERTNETFEKQLPDFLAVPYEKDGKFYDRTTDPEVIKWLKILRNLGQEGYLPEDIFVDKRPQMEEKIAQGRYFCMMFKRTDFAKQEKILYENDPNSIYIAVDGPKNSNGDPHTLTAGGISGWTLTLISKKCKNPDRAIELMSYMMSEEGQKLIWFGPKGVGYDEVDGKPVVKPEVWELLSKDRNAYDQQIGGDSTYWMLMDNAMYLQWYPGLPEPLNQLEEWTYPYAFSTSEYGDVEPPAGSEEETINLKVKELYMQSLIKMLLAKSDAEFDKILNDFLAKRDEMGFQRLQEYRTKRMIENKKKLGVQ